MEGVPRVPMLNAELKFAVGSVDFAPKIKEHIAQHYKEDPAKFEGACDALSKLREKVCRSAADEEGCAVNQRYYAQLLLLRNRVPLEDGDSSAIAFAWYDKCMDLSNSVSHSDIQFEQACIMHNLGALHSHIGAAQSRITLDGIKTAFSHFQQAAWPFQHVREQLCAAKYSIDFDPAAMTFYHSLMLAQAQECVLEKSLLDNRKNGTIAKIAKQTSTMYGNLIELLQAPNIAETILVKDYTRWCKIKLNLYMSIAYLYLGNECSDAQKMGERLTWFRASAERFNDCVRLAEKETNECMKETIKFIRDCIANKYTNALKENNFIYHDKVPQFSTLPDIAGLILSASFNLFGGGEGSSVGGVCLVKAVGFDPLDPAIAGEDLFKELVPLSVHQSSSVYSEQKDALLRKIRAKVDDSNQALQAFLASMKLDELSLSEETNFDKNIPEALLERSAAFNAQTDAVPQVLEAIARLTGCYQEVDSKLRQLNTKYTTVEKMMDTAKVSNTERAQLNAINEQLISYAKAHQQATGSNTELQRAVAENSQNLKLLAMPLSDLLDSLPKNHADFESLPETVSMRRVLDKVEEMSSQREMLIGQLRQQLSEDELTQKLLTMKHVDATDFFSEELQKHSAQIALIEQNLAAQSNIERALVEANAAFAQLRATAQSTSQARNTQIMCLLAAYDVYVDVCAKAEQGRLFYQRLLEKLRSLDDRLEDVEELIKAKAPVKEVKAVPRPPTEQPSPQQQNVSGSEAPARPSAASQAAERRANRAKEGGDRPRLADYMEYYRMKKAGLDAPPPSGPPGPAPASLHDPPIVNRQEAEQYMAANNMSVSQFSANNNNNQFVQAQYHQQTNHQHNHAQLPAAHAQQHSPHSFDHSQTMSMPSQGQVNASQAANQHMAQQPTYSNPNGNQQHQSIAMSQPQQFYNNTNTVPTSQYAPSQQQAQAQQQGAPPNNQYPPSIGHSQQAATVYGQNRNASQQQQAMHMPPAPPVQQQYNNQAVMYSTNSVSLSQTQTPCNTTNSLPYQIQPGQLPQSQQQQSFGGYNNPNAPLQQQQANVSMGCSTQNVQVQGGQFVSSTIQPQQQQGMGQAPPPPNNVQSQAQQQYLPAASLNQNVPAQQQQQAIYGQQYNNNGAQNTQLANPMNMTVSQTTPSSQITQQNQYGAFNGNLQSQSQPMPPQTYVQSSTTAPTVPTNERPASNMPMSVSSATVTYGSPFTTTETTNTNIAQGSAPSPWHVGLPGMGVLGNPAQHNQQQLPVMQQQSPNVNINYQPNPQGQYLPQPLSNPPTQMYNSNVQQQPISYEQSGMQPISFGGIDELLNESVPLPAPLMPQAQTKPKSVQTTNKPVSSASAVQTVVSTKPINHVAPNLITATAPVCVPSNTNLSSTAAVVSQSSAASTPVVTTQFSDPKVEQKPPVIVSTVAANQSAMSPVIAQPMSMQPVMGSAVIGAFQPLPVDQVLDPTKFTLKNDTPNRMSKSEFMKSESGTDCKEGNGGPIEGAKQETDAFGGIDARWMMKK